MGGLMAAHYGVTDKLRVRDTRAKRRALARVYIEKQTFYRESQRQWLIDLITHHVSFNGYVDKALKDPSFINKYHRLERDGYLVMTPSMAGNPMEGVMVFGPWRGNLDNVLLRILHLAFADKFDLGALAKELTGLGDLQKQRLMLKLKLPYTAEEKRRLIWKALR
jgi:hypothetical protein